MPVSGNADADVTTHKGASKEMSIFGSVGGFFKKLFGSTLSWSQKLSTVLTLTGPTINLLLLDTAGTEYAAEVTQVIHEIQSDLAAAAKLVADSHGTNGSGVAASLINILDGVTANLDSLLAAGHIKNAATVAKVKALVETVDGEAKALQSLVPQTQSPSK